MIPVLAPQRIDNSNRMPRPFATFGTSAADLAYGTLRDAIVSLRLTPGEKLVRKDLSHQLGISVTPLRDALLRLETVALVETRPQSETRVSLIDRQRLFELQFQRIALESEVVHRLARRGDLAISADDRAFHQSLFKAVGMDQVFLGFMERYTPMQRCQNVVPRPPEHHRQTLDFRRQILARLSAKDANGAVSAMRALLSGKGAMIGQAQRIRPDWFH